MRDRGKGVEYFNGDPCFMDTSLELIPCKKHPSSASSSSGGGICAFCLRDKLAQLVCPECGEQRLPNCSCSAAYSAFSEPKMAEPEILRRSNSTCVTDVSSRGGFWKFRKLFRKKKEKGGFHENPIETGVTDSKNDIWGSDSKIAMQRSRSLCSFRGGGGGGNGGGGGGGGGLGASGGAGVVGGGSFYDNDDSGFIHSAARASSVSGGLMMESAKMSCFSESEARMSNFEGRFSNFDYDRGIYTMREGYEFSCGEDPKFIDLKLDLPSSSSEIRTEHSGYRRGSNDFYGGFSGGESCRYSVSENEIKKCRKSRKGWRWFRKG